MKAIVCPDCLTKDLELRVCLQGAPCHRCGVAPTTVLTKGEIKACLRAKHGTRGAST